jgi:hypothetical protein
MVYGEKVESKLEEILSFFNEMSHLISSNFLVETFEIYPNCKLFPKLLLKIFLSLQIETPDELKEHLEDIEPNFLQQFDKTEIRIEDVEFKEEENKENEKMIKNSSSTTSTAFNYKRLNHFTIGLANVESLFKTTKYDTVSHKKKEKRKRKKIYSNSKEAHTTPVQSIVLVKDSPMMSTDDLDDLIIPGSPE